MFNFLSCIIALALDILSPFFQNQNNYHLFITFHSLAREFNFYICFIMAITLLQTKSKAMGKKDKKSIFMFIIRLEHTVTC